MLEAVSKITPLWLGLQCRTCNTTSRQPDDRPLAGVDLYRIKLYPGVVFRNGPSLVKKENAFAIFALSMR